MLATSFLDSTKRSRLDIQDSVCGRQHTLVLSGEIDLSNAFELEAMIEHVCTGRSESIAIDLSEVTFIDSTGLNVVLRANELCRDRAYEFRVILGDGPVHRLFEISGLLPRFGG